MIVPLLAFNDIELYLKAVAEETRLKIIAYLAIDTFCVCELVELLQISQPSISQHLRRLKQSEIIVEERRGKWIFYSLNKQHQLYTFLLHLVSTLPSLNKNVTNLVVDGKRVLCE